MRPTRSVRAVRAATSLNEGEPRLLPVAIFLLIAGCAQALPTTSQPAPASVAFVGVTVVPMTGGDSILADRTVLVRDGLIVAIGSAALVEVPAGALRIDARGQYLMPGLIDSHVHLEYFDDPRILGLFLANGVTSVRNMDGRPYLLDWKRRIASGEITGPTIYTAGPILDGDPPARDDNTVVRDAAEARAAVAAQDSAGYDFVKVYTNVSPDVYRAVMAAARERGRPVAGHAPRRVSLQDVLGSGQHSLEHLSDLDEFVEADSSSVRGRFHWSKLYLAMAADPEKMADAARRTAAAGIWVVPTVIQADRAIGTSDSMRTWLAEPGSAYIPADGRGLWEGQLTRIASRLDSADWKVVARGRANRRAMLAALHAAGAKLAIGTDTPNPFVVPGFSVHQELDIFIASGFSPRQALEAATIDASQLMGVATVTGTVEVGKRADLLLLASNPLAHVGNVRAPVGVMVRGTWLPASDLEAMLTRIRRE